MARTLEDMKKDRGGFCHQCGTDIMSPEQGDHTYCNDCWDFLCGHTFEPYEDGCNLCDQPKEHRMHNAEWMAEYGKKFGWSPE